MTVQNRLRILEQQVAQLAAAARIPPGAREAYARIAATNPVSAEDQARHRVEALADVYGPRRFTSLDPQEVLRLKPDHDVVDLIAVNRALAGEPTPGLSREDRRLAIAKAAVLGLPQSRVAQGLGISEKSVNTAVDRYRRRVREETS